LAIEIVTVRAPPYRIVVVLVSRKSRGEEKSWEAVEVVVDVVVDVDVCVTVDVETTVPVDVTVLVMVEALPSTVPATKMVPATMIAARTIAIGSRFLWLCSVLKKISHTPLTMRGDLASQYVSDRFSDWMVSSLGLPDCCACFSETIDPVPLIIRIERSNRSRDTCPRDRAEVNNRFNSKDPNFPASWPPSISTTP
jgi:hypothetical protein